MRRCFPPLHGEGQARVASQGGEAMSTSRARRLRATMTEMEVRLWSRLKRLRAEGFQFRRQAPFLGYYLDFVCYQRRLVIEVDGAHHGGGQQEQHDFVRDKILRREGFAVLRFWNRSVKENIDGVMHAIRTELAARPETPWSRGAPPP